LKYDARHCTQLTDHRPNTGETIKKAGNRTGYKHGEGEKEKAESDSAIGVDPSRRNCPSRFR